MEGKAFMHQLKCITDILLTSRHQCLPVKVTKQVKLYILLLFIHLNNLLPVSLFISGHLPGKKTEIINLV